MLDARFSPLPKWNRGELKNLTSQFKATYQQTLDKLEYELKRIGAREIRIEAGYFREQIRNDGWPRGGVMPAHPGVVVYFETDAGALCFPCGTYKRMESNLHAVANTLECLRAVDRYGVTKGHEQYAGFLALPAPATKGTVDEAALVLASFAGVPKDFILENAETFRNAYRKAAAKHHPDVTGTTAPEWYELQNAAALLEEFFAGKLER